MLAKQLPPARERLQIAEQNLSRYEITHNIADLSTQTTSTVNAAINTDQKINQVELDKRQADAQIASLSSSLAGMTATTGGGTSTAQNPVLPTLRQKLADLTIALGSAQGHYTDSHPAGHQPQAADRRRQPPDRAHAADDRRVVEHDREPGVPAALAAAVGREGDEPGGVSAAHAAREAARGHQPADRGAAEPGAAPRRAQAQQTSAENTYNTLQQKYNDASIARTTGISDVTITQRAKELAAKTPHLALNLIIATIVGMMLGLGIVFLVDWFDGRIRDERDVEGELQLPVLASIPELPSGDGAAAIPANVRNATMESYFQLVLAMRYSSDRPLRSVTITSPLKGDGKSTVAMNVAGAFGEIAVSSIEREARVLVIDADMRRPSLHKKFEVSNELGLSDILIGRASLSQAVQRTDRPGVDVLPAARLHRIRSSCCSRTVSTRCCAKRASAT